jgi:hypothetical protein
MLPGPVKEYNFNKSHNNLVNNALNIESAYGLTSNPTIDLRSPSLTNPFMNVPITDYDNVQLFKNYNRYKEPLVPSKETKKIENEVSDNFKFNLFQDAGSYFFEKDNSQRQFYSVPNGSVPNDQNGFANWLYSVPYNCKHGSIYNRYGVKYTDDSLMCTGNNSGNITNFGQLKK